MQEDDLPRADADLEEVNARLNDGLQCCRSVLANYKSLLAANDPGAANDDGDLSDIESAQERT